MIIRHPKLVWELMAYAQIAQAERGSLDELLASVLEELADEGTDVEFETNDLSERIDFLIHVLGAEEADEAVRAAIDGELVIEEVED